MFRIQTALRLVISQPEFYAAIFCAFAQDVQRAFLTDFMSDPGAELLRRIRAVLLLQFGVFVGLGGLEKTDDFFRHQAQVFVG